MNVELESLIGRSRIEVKELQYLEKQRVALLLEPARAGRDQALVILDQRMKELDSSRNRLLKEIAERIPGYEAALQYAAELFGFDPEVGTVRFNKHQGESFTFEMPEKPVMAVWVENGEVVRSEPIDW